MSFCSLRSFASQHVSKVHWVGLVFATLLLSGCAQLDSGTVVMESGEFERSVTFKFSKSTSFGGEEKPDLKQYVWAEGEGWEVAEKETEEDFQVTLTKQVRAGEESLIHLKGSETMVLKSSTVVKDGEFVETWSATGTPDLGSFENSTGELKSVIEKIAELDSETAAKVAKASNLELWEKIFGPPLPILSYAFHPQIMERQFQVAAFNALERSLKEFGDEKSKEHAVEIARIMSSNELIGGPGNEGEDNKSDNSLIISMNVKLSAPGMRFSEFNGVENPIAGTIEWSFYPQAATFEPIVLRSNVLKE